MSTPNQSKARFRATAPKVFIIILNWNNWQDTLECLKSLKNLDYPNYEVVVVDNGSTDDSVKQIINATRKDLVALIETGKNLGFSGGNNVGIKYALEHGADYALILNNDTVVESNFLKKLVEVGESDENIGVLGPRINYIEPKDVVWFNGGKFSWPLKYNYHLDFRKKEGELKNFKPREVDFITGAAMFVKRSVFDKIGLLDERFFLYFEDMDFCLRAKSAGFKSVVVPEAKIYHKVSASVSKLKNPVIWYYHVRNYLLLVKNTKGPALNLFTQLWAAWMYGKQIVKQILFPAKKEYANYIKTAVSDFYQGKFGKYEDRN